MRTFIISQHNFLKSLQAGGPVQRIAAGDYWRLVYAWSLSCSGAGEGRGMAGHGIG